MLLATQVDTMDFQDTKLLGAGGERVSYTEVTLQYFVNSLFFPVERKKKVKYAENNYKQESL